MFAHQQPILVARSARPWVGRSRWSACWVALALLCLGMPTRALAQVSDGALAEELFRQGKGLMAEERYGEACPKLAESQRLDPSTGTLLNLAVCHEKQGKLATAWNEFNEALLAAQRDGRTDRVAYARERIAAIEPNLSRVTLVLPEAHDVKGLRVELDGTVVGRPALGVALPIDPGAHTIVVSAPGKKSWEATVEVPEGASKKSVTLPRLLDAPEAPAAASGSTGAVSSSLTDAPPSGSGQKYIAYGLAGLGVVGLGLGTYFGLDAKKKYDESNDGGCVGNDCPTGAAELRNSARDAGNLSTIAFVAGAAAVGAGVVVYLTAPSDEARPGAVGIRGRVRGTMAGASAELVASW